MKISNNEAPKTISNVTWIDTGINTGLKVDTYSNDRVYTTSTATTEKKYWLSGYFRKVIDYFGTKCYTTVSIKEVIYNDPATIVLWSDGTKTVAKCAEEDEYNPESGLSLCILKKICGGSYMKDVFTDWVPEDAWRDNTRVTLSDVRKKHK